jgi:hypothetical protein
MPNSSRSATRTRSNMVAADPVDIATVRALWCALHPDAAVRDIVDELVTEARDRPDVLREAMRRLRSGRLERSTWVVEPALAVLETALAETVASGTNDPGAEAVPWSTMAS